MKFAIKRLAVGILAAVFAAAALPLRAAAEGEHQRILNLHMDEAGARYEIYFAASLTDALFGAATISRSPNEEELESYQQAQNLAAAVITDETGSAAVHFTEVGLEDGVYLITGAECQPFYVCVPAPDGDGWLYTVDVHPGYLIGGEAEPKPSGSSTEITVNLDSVSDGVWGFEGTALLMAACCALFMQVFRLRRG